MNTSNTLTNSFAYVLGVVYGDGHCRLRKRGGETILKVKDEDFAWYFKKSLDSFSKLNSRLFEKDGFYFTYLASKSTAEKILSFDLSIIIESDDNKKINFLSGIYDSEGGIAGQNLNNRKYAKRWIHFSNNNKIIIKLMQTLLQHFDINYKIRSRVHSGFGSEKLQYEIIVYGLKDILWFHKKKIFKIKRKTNKLQEVVQSYEKINIKKAYAQQHWRLKNG